MTREPRITLRGTWPGAVILRSGWAKAHARPVNDDLEDALLRLERGGADFVRACVSLLLDHGAPAVSTVPLHTGNRPLWSKLGFRPHQELLLMERDLSRAIGEPNHPTRPGTGREWAEAVTIDRKAFATEWRIGRLGLTDAAGATPRSRFIVAPETSGYAIVGVAASTAYLQRIAVDPGRQRTGVGRSLVRACLQWAQKRSARTMLLNTQLDNTASVALYRSEGFEILPDRLVVLRATAEDIQ